MELLSHEMIDEELSGLTKGWETTDYIRINKEFYFNNFKEALNFANEVGYYAEILPHHPEITLSFGQAIVNISTHDLGGLSELDFELARRIDKLNLDKESKEILENIENLKSENDFIRRKAVGRLGKIGDVRAINPLIKALKDKDPFVRRLSAGALGKIGNMKSIYPLAVLLGDNKDDMSSSARDALINIGKPSLPQLLKRTIHKNVLTRRRAVGAIGQIGDEDAIAQLSHCLNDEDDGVRWRAIKYLKISWNAEVVETLRNIVKIDKSNKVREEASITLNKIEGDVRGLLPLFKKGINAISDDIEAKPLNSGGISYYSPERKFLFMAIFRSNPYKVRVELYQGNKRLKNVRTMKGSPEWGVLNFQNKDELNTVLEAAKDSYILIKKSIKQI
ncbi:hypothetical protein BK007_10015 [Methanobacterium subterraneum]|uniref:Putative pterin-4-alpha-carbinolamine dehydratase n=1 Tax=Methanobacterium subterraneum TaxID=59277 RepID=A0A2H4VDZ2_9EURY|nr:HEAT repeat domain-containing protein [Methanobacterium subterraneum]AUB56315.1 hypothetical protein BK007_10015 [Methanobacterium subterraneum]